VSALLDRISHQLEQPMTPNSAEFSRLKNALIYDVTQPFVFDNSCFANIIREEVKASPAPTIVEFGCGTGLLSMKLLSSFEHFDYYGIDLSLAMLAIFTRRLAGLCKAADRVTLVAPVDLRIKSALSTLVSKKADVVLMSQFLQYIPLRPDGDGYINKEEFLAQCREITKAGGRIVIVEDVWGESPQEHADLSSAWDRAVVARYTENLSVIEAGLNDVDPAFVQAVRNMIAHPGLVRMIREKRRAARGEEIISLSAWKQILANTGLTYRVYPHESLPNFYLLILER
jgi:SAM-dependent methyltransferase